MESRFGNGTTVSLDDESLELSGGGMRSKQLDQYRRFEEGGDEKRGKSFSQAAISAWMSLSATVKRFTRITGVAVA